MKKLFGVILPLLCLSFYGFSQGNQTAISVPANASGSVMFPALLHKPNDYATSSTSYPLVIFLHGTGESGNNLSKIYNNSGAGGPAYFIAQNQWPASFTNPANGQAYKFLVLSPQCPGWSTSATQLNYIIKNIVTNYRVDINRIYVTGLSAGGAGVIGYGINQDLEIGQPVTPFYKAAAIVPMSAAISDPPQSYGNAAVSNGVRAWGFGSVPADIHGEFTFQFINRMNTAQSGYGRFTNYNGGHCCWNTYYNPNYRETINGQSMNIYEWMLQYSRNGSTPPPPVNQSPIANAGVPQSITLPLNSVTVTGSGSDPDGTISSYNWTKISGPSQFTITSPSQAQTTITNLVQGAYQFQLRVTDNQGATGTSNITITVNPASAPTNQVPVANAGPDQNITLPLNSVNLSGSGTDPDGSISAYAWARVSGPTQFTLSNSAIANPVLSNLVAGTYVFRLTVTDNRSATAQDNITIQVNNATSVPGKSIPGKIEAEAYNSMSGIQTETTTDAGAGLNVGYIEAGDWMDYIVSVSAAGNYNVSFRVASPNAGSKLQLMAGSTVLTVADIPNTGSWQTWQTVTKSITLSAGTQTLRVHAVTGGWNINWLDFAQGQAPPPPPPPASGATKFVKVNIYAYTPYSNSEWNNWDLVGKYYTITSTSFKYSDGSASTINAILSHSDGVGDNGTNYSGTMAPAQVLRHPTYSSQARTLTLNGLKANTPYNVELYAGRNSNPGNSTQFSVNGVNSVVATYNNKDNKATFTGLKADATGKIVIGILDLNTYSYLNGFTIIENPSTTVVNTRAANVEIEETKESVQLTGETNDRIGLLVDNALTGMMEIEVADEKGVIVKEFSILKTSQEAAQVHLSTASILAGEYTVTVRLNEWSGSVKMVKK